MAHADIQIGNLEVAKIHSVEAPWVVLELPENFSPRFIHLKVGESLVLNISVQAGNVKATATDPPSFKTLVDEVARRLK